MVDLDGRWGGPTLRRLRLVDGGRSVSGREAVVPPVPGVAEIWGVRSGATVGLRRGSRPPANFSCPDLAGWVPLLHRGSFWGRMWVLAASNQSSASMGFSGSGGAISDDGAAALEVDAAGLVGGARGLGARRWPWPCGRRGGRGTACDGGGTAVVLVTGLLRIGDKELLPG